MKCPLLLTALATLVLATSCAGSETESEKEIVGKDKSNGKRIYSERFEPWGIEPFTLNGDIESITIASYEVADIGGETIIENCPSKLIIKFNERGDIIEESYLKDDRLESRYTFAYDLLGKTTEYHYNSDGSLSGKYYYTYDSKGNILEAATHCSDDSLKIKTFCRCKYDQQGNRIEKAHYDSEGSLAVKYCYKYKYNSQGKPIEKLYLDDNGSPRDKDVYSYDSQGNVIEHKRLRYNHDGELDRETTSSYNYDSQGNCTKEVYYNSDNPQKRTFINKFDSHGNMVESIMYKGDMMTPSYKEERTIVYRE